MVSKHRTDNDPIKNNFKTRKKKTPRYFLPYMQHFKRKKKKSQWICWKSRIIWQHCNLSVPSLSVPTKPTHPAKIWWKDDFVILIWILLKSESRLFTYVPSMCHSQGPWNKCGSPKDLAPPYCMRGLGRNARILQTANITQAHIHNVCKLKSQHTKICI